MSPAPEVGGENREARLLEEVATAERTSRAMVEVRTSDLQHVFRELHATRGVTAMPIDKSSRTATIKLRSEWARPIGFNLETYLVVEAPTPAELLTRCRLLHQQVGELVESARRFAGESG